MPAKFRGYSILFCLILWSCSNEKEIEQAPVSSQTMEQILFDLQVADSYSTMLQPDSLPPVNVKNKDSLARFYMEIFAFHKITEEEFLEAMRWYQERPAKLEIIYGNIQARLTEMGEIHK